MPADMKKYPSPWKQIRNEILIAAGGNLSDPRIGAKCQFCGVENYAVGYRDKDGKFHYIKGNIYLDTLEYADSYEEAAKVAEASNEWADPGEKYIVIVLTIAHLHDPNPMNVDKNNLAALCQRCHNKYDVSMRRKHAAQTRLSKSINAGQIVMPWIAPNIRLQQTSGGAAFCGSSINHSAPACC